MAKQQSVWGIDIGQVALKAIKLRNSDGQVQVEAFDVIEHPTVLSHADADVSGLIRRALEQFLDRNDVTNSKVCISVPGQSSFTRFVKLPPVETKKIPDIVRFEAEQQIPFPIADVIWRWQTFSNPDSPDVEVGIFAMKRSDIADMLQHFTDVEINVDLVQMAPLALYNYMAFDGQIAEQGATLLADVGADKTDLVVSDGAGIWTRTIQIGGNNFTEALIKAFKLSFKKAEKLKRTAASSKYARQIFQAMRPVFADLVQEVQRSIGYYTSLHRDARFGQLVGLGNGFRLPGLQKFLEQNLNVPVARVDSFNNLQLDPGVNAPVFTDNVLSVAVAYGLAIQGLGEGAIDTNLLPAEISSARRWAKKRPWFAAAGAVVLATLAMPLFREYSDRATLTPPSNDLQDAKNVAGEFKRLETEFNQVRGQLGTEEEQIKEIRNLYKYRDFWPAAQDLISRGFARRFAHQSLLTRYAQASDEQQQEAILAEIAAIPRSERRMVFMERMVSTYNGTLQVQQPASETGGESAEPARGFEIEILGRTPLSEAMAVQELQAVLRECSALGREYPMLSVVDFAVKGFGDSAVLGASRSTFSSRSASPGGGLGGSPMPGGMGGSPMPGGGFGSPMMGGAGYRQPGEEIDVAEIPDPMFPDDPDEDQADDTKFVVRVVIAIEEPQDEASEDFASGGGMGGF